MEGIESRDTVCSSELGSPMWKSIPKLASMNSLPSHAVPETARLTVLVGHLFLEELANGSSLWVASSNYLVDDPAKGNRVVPEKHVTHSLNSLRTPQSSTDPLFVPGSQFGFCLAST